MSGYNMIFAGFGGQGVLFTAKITAVAGMIANKEVSWYPSYGPEMRGGTANCSVCLADDPIGSPLVTEPDALVVMNTPSFTKFISKVVPGGNVIVDSTLVDCTTDRTDITIHAVPATQLAKEQNLAGISNMILLGKLIKETNFVSLETVEQALIQSVPAKKSHLLEHNLRALRLGCR
ncbi:MAG: 2-oxoacid:acceptor oxidoreductase family protein [Sporomusa sp.]